MDDGRFQLDPPIHLVTGDWGCWRCGESMTVAAILCENVGSSDAGPYILTNTVELPTTVIAFIQKRCPTYRLKYSRTVGRRYFANNCPKCGMISGDFYLHSEPGGPFFPTNQRWIAERSATNPTVTSEPVLRGPDKTGTGTLRGPFPVRFAAFFGSQSRFCQGF